ncbi:MAG: MarR family winged helix-turn-helix transcriptional regulator [Armatimonadota bacterium]|nr:MarR family winged helix-turn-helix transcriptional regulator [Armatimonadota bacterium]
MVLESPSKASVLSDVFAQLIRFSLSERIVEALTSAQITYAQYEALRYVQSHPYASVGELAHGLRISYPSTTNMISRLARKAMVKKKGMQSDKRIVRLILTPAGEQLVEQVRDERGKRIGEIMGAMTDDERIHFLEALDNFITAAGRCGLADPKDLCLSCGPGGLTDCSLHHVGGDYQCR